MANKEISTDRDLMIDVILRIEEIALERPSPMSAPYSFYIDSWVEKAQPEWVDIMLDLLTNPPDSPRIDSSVLISYDGVSSGTAVEQNREAWSRYIAEFLQAWVEKDAKRIIPRIGPFLGSEKLRSTLLEAFYMTSYTDMDGTHVQWLRPLLEKLDNLSRDEVRYLIVALGRKNLTPETQGFIEQIHDHIPKDDEELQWVVDYSLNRRDYIWPP